MDKFLESAKKILLEINKPLHTKIITELAVKKGYLKTIGKTPAETMGSIIYSDIKKKGDKSFFVKVKPAIFKINKDNNSLKPSKTYKPYTVEELEIITNTKPPALPVE